MIDHRGASLSELIGYFVMAHSKIYYKPNLIMHKYVAKFSPEIARSHICQQIAVISPARAATVVTHGSHDVGF